MSRSVVGTGTTAASQTTARPTRPRAGSALLCVGTVVPMGYQVTKSDEEWREQLSREEYDVLRKAGTERPFTGEYTDTKKIGVYRCRACNEELFRSETKFESHCGWPSFYAPLAEDRVEYIEDTALGMKRVEVRCGNCGSHLGHVFEGEGYGTPTDQRYCINSISLTLEPTE